MRNRDRQEPARQRELTLETAAIVVESDEKSGNRLPKSEKWAIVRVVFGGAFGVRVSGRAAPAL
jgi:hypothetical protein